MNKQLQKSNTDGHSYKSQIDMNTVRKGTTARNTHGF